MRRLLLGVLAAFAVLCCGAAGAHEMSMAEMTVREAAPGEFTWQWTATNDRQGTAVDMRPMWPEGCRAEANLVHCGPKGMSGTLKIEGVGQRYSAALVKIAWAGGEERVYTLTAGQPTVQLHGAADDNRGWYEIGSAYTVLGIEHILGGVDHLLFVIGLLFLVGFERRLFWTITAFTAAHSLTLARRWPALVAFGFGLVHGLGFAGALKEIGLPQDHLPMALLSFNVGVEIGQLFTVALAWLVWRALAARPKATKLRTAALYGIGTMAAWWSWLRVAAVLGF